MSLICPQNTRVIPGQMTAMLRAKFGLNDVLSLTGEKNRNDHRHHAVDACVIGVTDQGLLQRFANASASTREKQLNRLVEKMPLPWDTYREHVQRAVNHIWVSHKPDHSHEGAMHEDTAWGLLPDGLATRRVRGEDGKRQRETKNRTVIPFSSTRDQNRHGVDEQGLAKNYKGYVGGSNFCMDIVLSDNGKWEGEVVSTYMAYQTVLKHGAMEGLKLLRSGTVSLSGRKLVMRLQQGDPLRMLVDDEWRLMQFVAVGATSGQMTFAGICEANSNARNGNKADPFSYTTKYAGSLQKTKARRVTISPIGELRDPGFKD